MVGELLAPGLSLHKHSFTRKYKGNRVAIRSSFVSMAYGPVSC